jgi:outer membrane protein assembly factor BamB
MRRANVLSSCVLVVAGAACGGSGTFRLTSEDNNPERLAQAFARAEPPATGAPIGRSGQPRVYVATAGKKDQPGRLLAYDLAAQKTVWTVDGEVASRVVVGADFVAHLDDAGRVVARASESGKRLWQHGVGGGKFLGITADRERVFYVVEQGGSKPTWELVALAGQSGSELWRAPSPGQLGTPAARGGLVLSPFLKQWLVVLDARTGEQLARIRGIDEEISFVRGTTEDVYFGSKTGVFLLDERAASGRKADSTYGAAKLPDEFVRSFYHWDAFDPVQANYSAYDRNRILWRAAAAGGRLGFRDDHVVVHTYRFFFGFHAGTGELTWAYNHPRVDAVSSDHLGHVIGFVSLLGDLGALDPTTGARVYRTRIDVGTTTAGAPPMPARRRAPPRRWCPSRAIATSASSTSSCSPSPRWRRSRAATSAGISSLSSRTTRPRPRCTTRRCGSCAGARTRAGWPIWPPGSRSGATSSPASGRGPSASWPGPSAS